MSNASAQESADRIYTQMGGAKRQRQALLQGRQNLLNAIGHCMNDIQTEKAALNSAELAFAQEEINIATVRLKLQNEKLNELIDDLDQQDARIQQYEERLETMLNLADAGVVIEVDKG